MEKILVIDDSLLEQKILSDMLKEDYQIIGAQNGEDGIELAKREKPSLILLDIIMPGLDGFETLKKLKNDRRTMNIPVVILTAIEDEKTEERGLLKGAMDYIRKPYNPNIVKVRVDTQVKMYCYRKMIETQMSMDALTDICNRRDFERKKREMWERGRVEQKMLSLFFVDIDYFKSVNDTYGHTVGDMVLSKVAGCMKKVIREDENHYLARYGGEEFVVLIYNQSLEEVKKIAEDLRESVQQLQIPNEKSKVCPVVTISIGGCSVVPKEESLEEFIRKADKLLYQGKNNGRNCVIWAP
ncbi:MAG: diguanylate cyclase [Lachnospiraceae bacterium]